MLRVEIIFLYSSYTIYCMAKKSCPFSTCLEESARVEYLVCGDVFSSVDRVRALSLPKVETNKNQ